MKIIYIIRSNNNNVCTIKICQMYKVPSFHLNMRFYSHASLTHLYINGCTPVIALIAML